MRHRSSVPVWEALTVLTCGYVARAVWFAMPDTADELRASTDEAGVWSTPWPAATAAIGLVFGPNYRTHMAYDPRGRPVSVAEDLAGALDGRLEIHRARKRGAAGRS